MAEGSDWCWWYGDDHTSGNDEVFDELYRRHLMNIYHLIGEKVPEALFASILESAGGGGPAPEEVTSLISPRIDGRVSSYFEWLGRDLLRNPPPRLDDAPDRRAGLDVLLRHQHRAALPARRLPGRVPRPGPVRRRRAGPRLEAEAAADRHPDGLVRPRQPTSSTRRPGARRELPDGTAAIAEILEAGIPWSVLGAALGDRVQFHLSLEKDGNTLASWPMTGSFTVGVPDADFERRMWSV